MPDELEGVTRRFRVQMYISKAIETLRLNSHLLTQDDISKLEAIIQEKQQ